MTRRRSIYAFADAIEPRYRALVLTATFTGLRLGELRALTRRRLDLLHATVHVTEQIQELKDVTLVVGPPKTAAGVRRVAIPEALVPELEAHLGRWALLGPTVSCSGYTGPTDAPSELVHHLAASCARCRRRTAPLPRPAGYRTRWPRQPAPARENSRHGSAARPHERR